MDAVAAAADGDTVPRRTHPARRHGFERTLRIHDLLHDPDEHEDLSRPRGSSGTSSPPSAAG